MGDHSLWIQKPQLNASVESHPCKERKDGAPRQPFVRIRKRWRAGRSRCILPWGRARIIEVPAHP
jgi:hypothetical protein